MKKHKIFNMIPGLGPARIAITGLFLLLAAEATALSSEQAAAPSPEQTKEEGSPQRADQQTKPRRIKVNPDVATKIAGRAALGSSITTAGHVARNSIRVAIVDSGIDATHETLSSRISHVSVIDPRNRTGRDHATLLAGIVARSTTENHRTTNSLIDVSPATPHDARIISKTQIAPQALAKRDHRRDISTAIMTKSVSAQSAASESISGRSISAGSSEISGAAGSVIDLVDIRASYHGENDAILFDPTAVAVGIASAAGGSSLTDGSVIHVLDPKAEADIINISIGGGSTENTTLIQKAMRQAARAGKILVVAAGNAGRAEPDYPARMILDPEIAGLGLVVVNMMQNKAGAWVLNEQSNRCGETAAYCVAAPGTDIESLLAGGKRGQATGTSLAAAHVSAALARIKAQNPHLDNRAVVAHLLAHSGRRDQAGDKTRARATNPETGHGFIGQMGETSRR